MVTAKELIFGAFNKPELNQILNDIAHLHLFHINEVVSAISLELMKEYSLSHKLTIPDALIAATAIEKGLPLYTLNKKDFRFLPNLQLY